MSGYLDIIWLSSTASAGQAIQLHLHLLPRSRSKRERELSNFRLRYFGTRDPKATQ